MSCWEIGIIKPCIFTEMAENEPVAGKEEFRHRCLPTKVINFIDYIKKNPKKEERLQRIIDAGFGVMLNLAPLKQIPHFFLEFSVKGFNKDGCYLVLDDERILYLTEADVERVYSLPRGDTMINLKEGTQDARDKLCQDLRLEIDGNVSLVPSPQFEVAINHQDTEDKWFKAALLYMIGSLLCPRANPLISIKYADILEKDLDNLTKYIWCHHVLQHTAKALVKKHN